jgi:ankyrin repeat protein
MKLLVEHGADTNMLSYDGCTPLHTIVRNGYSSNRATIVRMLPLSGATPSEVKTVRGSVVLDLKVCEKLNPWADCARVERWRTKVMEEEVAAKG